jgi:diketogulonate reductase-like aldo/keto reductase
VGQLPALGFGTLIPDPALTISATRDALEAGFRHFDCAERYRNEREVGEVLATGLATGVIKREDVFVTTIRIPEMRTARSSTIAASLCSIRGERWKLS